MKLYTIGHSVADLPELIDVLRANDIDVLVDVRSKPRSRMQHFDLGPLEAALEDAGIRYRFLGDRLGGMPRDPEIAERWRQGRLDAIIVAHLRSTDDWQDGLAELSRLVSALRRPHCLHHVQRGQPRRVSPQGGRARHDRNPARPHRRASLHPQVRAERSRCPRSTAMSRTIVLTDVTAMSGDAVCIAGIDLVSDQTVRLAQPQPTQRLVETIGGLAPGDILKLDCKPLRNAEPPHLEDCEWNPRSVKKVGVSSIKELQCAFASTIFNSVSQAFGDPSIKGRNGNSAWEPGSGTRSLATIAVCYVRACADKNDRVRLAFKDEALDYWPGVPLQDLRVKQHAAKCDTCHNDALNTIREEFDANRTLVRVGLTRPFAPEGSEPVCWLQVTNILAKPREHFV